jgi:hypothetical protein
VSTFELELSWLVYKATRDTWMTDDEHREWKRLAWNEAQQLARTDPDRYSAMPAALAEAIRAALH